jgi:ribosomal protein L15
MKSNNTSRGDTEARGSGRDSGRSERGSRSGVGRTGYREARMATAAHVGDGVPLLRYGPDNNYAKFKERLSRAAIEKYVDLGRLVVCILSHQSQILWTMTSPTIHMKSM